MAYNIKRMTNVLGATKLTENLHQAWAGPDVAKH
jgi:hypothetical protein